MISFCFINFHVSSSFVRFPVPFLSVSLFESLLCDIIDIQAVFSSFSSLMCNHRQVSNFEIIPVASFMYGGGLGKLSSWIE